eukprot:COSAG04_NODE_662_length_11447_cov_3.759958_1_plen_282_part_10
MQAKPARPDVPSSATGAARLGLRGGRGAGASPLHPALSPSLRTLPSSRPCPLPTLSPPAMPDAALSAQESTKLLAFLRSLELERHYSVLRENLLDLDAIVAASRADWKELGIPAADGALMAYRAVLLLEGEEGDAVAEEEEEDGADEMLSLEEMLEEAKREQAEDRAAQERRQAEEEAEAAALLSQQQAQAALNAQAKALKAARQKKEAAAKRAEAAAAKAAKRERQRERQQARRRKRQEDRDKPFEADWAQTPDVEDSADPEGRSPVRACASAARRARAAL